MSSESMTFDKDLSSIQEARILLRKAKTAQKEYEKLTQEEVDVVIAHLAESIYKDAELLAKMAVEETGYGNVKDKIFKNQFAARNVHEYIKDMKTRGVIRVDEEKKVWDIGVALGVLVGIVPSTNPTSTTIYKSLISLKSGNAIVISPHPAAVGCIGKTVELLQGYLQEVGMCKDLISVLSTPTMEGTNALMKSDDTSMILATGGSAMVKSAYSSGTPALGVGPGNVPAFIERSACIPDAVEKIIRGKTFDGGVICASEQAVVVEDCIRDEVIEEFKKQGCHFATPEQKVSLEQIIQTNRGTVNPKIVGKTPAEIGRMAGITVPETTKVILACETEVGKEYPFSIEKLSPLLGFYSAPNWEAACDKCIELLDFGGLGHSLAIHSTNESVIREFALRKPVSRMLVNTPSTHGAIGATTSLAPAFTLGCGTVGGSATSDNVTPLNLINIRRVAFGLEETTPHATSLEETEILEIVKRVVRELNV